MGYALQELPDEFHSLSERVVPPGSQSLQRGGQVSRVEAGFRSIRSDIWSDLPLPALQPRSDATHKNIIDVYSDSHERLERYRDEGNELLEAICIANTLSYEDHSLVHEILTKEVAKQFTPIQIPSLPVDQQVGAELGRTDVMVAYSTLATALANSLDEFLVGFANGLATLHGAQTVGSIEWTNESMCRFTYTLKEILPSAVVEEVTRTSKRSIDRTWTKESADYVTVSWYMEHHLTRGKMKSRLGLPRDSPPRAQRMWDTLPIWLADHVGVVQGDLLRKHANEVARWDDSVVRESYQEEVLPQADPAITLFDQLVLTAWDQKELVRSRPVRTVNQVSKPIQSDSRIPVAPVPVNDNITFAVENLGASLFALFIPAALSFVCSIWFPHAFGIPILAAMLATLPWVYNFLDLNSLQQNAGQPSDFRFLGICTGVLASCASVTLPHAIVTQSPLTFMLSMFAVCGAVGCWVSVRNMLDKISS